MSNFYFESNFRKTMKKIVDVVKYENQPLENEEKNFSKNKEWF